MINLLPPDVKQQTVYKKRNSLLVKYLIATSMIVGLVALTMLAGGYFLYNEQRQLDQEITTKQSQLAELNKQAAEARELSKQVDTIAKLLNSEIQFSSLLPTIAGLIPTGAQLNNLTLDEAIEDPLILVADVDSQNTAAVLRQNLEDSELFQSADIQSITPAGGKKQLIVNLQVVFNPEAQL